ncbi:MAG: hypothetical protein MI923_24185 [Phycisphaerales bacterium]|nr:hypothetical protein [Phycisphaerales bacterium]
MPSDTPTKSRRRFLLRFLLVGVVLTFVAMIVLGGELLVRYRKSKDLDRRISELERLVVSNVVYNSARMKGYEGRDDVDPGEHFRLRRTIPRTYRPYIEYRRVPYESQTTNINSLGYRGSEFDIVKKEGVFRILIYGGSFVWGTGAITDRETIAGHLEAMLNAERKEGPTFEVINCGETAYNSTQELVFLMIEGVYLSPDLVISLDGVNDTGLGYTELPAGYPFMFDQINSLMCNNRRLRDVFTIEDELDYLKKSRSLVWKVDGMALIEQLQRLIDSDQGASAWRQGDFTTAEEFALRHFTNLRCARGLADEFGFKFGAAIQPNALFHKPLHEQEQQVMESLTARKTYYDRFNWWRDHYSRYTDMVVHLCEDVELPVIDLRRVYENNSDQIYIDDCHVTGEGYRIVAEAIHDWIRDSQLIPGGFSEHTALKQ